MDDIIGPSLLNNKHKNVNKEETAFGPKLPDAAHKESEGFMGPSLPRIPPSGSLSKPEEVDIGPRLPPHLIEVQNTKDDDDAIFGPALPPQRKQSSELDDRVLGPQLPPGFKRQDLDEEDDDNDEDSVIGPLPPSHDTEEENKRSIAREFEMRARKMKNKLEGKDEPEKLEREEWMTELPPVLQGNFGMGPRQFRARAVEVGDRSGWTDTPADKLKKAQGDDKPEERKVKKIDTYVVERDAKLAMQMKDYQESTKQESLMSMHEKKRKRKFKEDEESGAANIRRPFDRELDLQAGRFDEAAKKRMLKKSEGLASRFSHGETSGTFL